MSVPCVQSCTGPRVVTQCRLGGCGPVAAVHAPPGSYRAGPHTVEALERPSCLDLILFLFYVKMFL